MTITGQIDMAAWGHEARGAHGEWVAALAGVKARHPGVQLEVTPTGGLSLIRTTGERGKGLAKAALKDLTDTADKHRVTLHLTPEPLAGDKTTSKKRLTQWYASQGFVPNSGRNKDYAISDTMLRPPTS